MSSNAIEQPAAEVVPSQTVEVAPETNAAAAADAEPDEGEEAPEVQAGRIAAAIARARGALEEVKTKVKDYDAQYKASETASAHLGGAIAKAQSAFDELASVATALKDKTVEIPTKALTRTIAAANSSLEKISEVASTYDDKFKLSSTVKAAVDVPRAKCAEALSEVSNRAAAVSAAANAKLQGINDGLRARALSIASVGANMGANMLFNTAAAIQGRYAIEEKAASAGTTVSGKAIEIDEKYNVKDKAGALVTGVLEKAGALDGKVTGGKLTPWVLSAYESGLALAQDGLAYSKEGYDAAKATRQSLSEGQKLVDAPASPEAPAEAATATEATNQSNDAPAKD